MMLAMRHERAYEMIEPMRMHEPTSLAGLFPYLYEFITPKERRRRKTRNKIAKLSRKRNRGK